MENIKFKKNLGQNFIFDTNLLRAIVNDAGITSDDDVLEIGVGAGTLTKEICQKANKVISFEIDTDLKERIENTLEGQNNSTVIYKDFMEVTNEEIFALFGGDIKVVANLPYYITTPIIFRLLEIPKIKSITIIVQKEVAASICAKNNSSDYGILTIMINSVADTSIRRIVNRKMFTPSPNVDSAICHIEINRNKYNIRDYKFFEKVVQSAFLHRRKMLISNLKNTFGYSGDFLLNVFNKLNLNNTIRGEALSIDEFVALADMLRKEK